MEMYIFALNLTCMEQINTIDKISAVYRNTAEEARQELNKVQQKIYRIGSLRLLLFVAGVVGIIYFWSESWGILACIALITLLPFLFLMKYHNRLFHRKDYLEKKMEINEQELENTKKQFETAKVDVGKPFNQEEELTAKTARLNELNALLNVDKRENEIVGGEPDEGDDTPTPKNKDRER